MKAYFFQDDEVKSYQIVGLPEVSFWQDVHESPHDDRIEPIIVMAGRWVEGNLEIVIAGDNFHPVAFSQFTGILIGNDIQDRYLELTEVVITEARMEQFGDEIRSNLMLRAREMVFLDKDQFDNIVSSANIQEDMQEGLMRPTLWNLKVPILAAGDYNGLIITEETLRELAGEVESAPVMIIRGHTPIRVTIGVAREFKVEDGQLIAILETEDNNIMNAIRNNTIEFSPEIVINEENNRWELLTLNVVTSPNTAAPLIKRLPKVFRCPDCGKEVSETNDALWACLDCKKLFTKVDIEKQKPVEPEGRKVRP